MNKTLKACLIAPMVPIVAYFVAYIYGDLTGNNEFYVQRLLNASIAIVFFGGIVSYTITGLFAVPIYFLLRTFDIVSWKTLLPTAAALGCLYVFYNQIWPYIGELPSDTGPSFYAQGCQQVLDGVLTQCGFRIALVGMIEHGALGLLSGLVFWLIYKKGHFESSRAS